MPEQSGLAQKSGAFMNLMDTGKKLEKQSLVVGVRILPRLLAVAGLLVLTPLAWADSSTKQEYQLQSGPLNQVIKAVSEKSGVLIDYDAAALGNLSAPAIRGSFDAREALSAALAGSNWVAVLSADGKSIQLQQKKALQDDAQALAAVTVTGASNKKESLQRVPTAVSRTSGDFLEKQHIDDIQDLQYIVPGLFVQSTESNDTQITIRGIGDGGGQSSGDQNIGMPSSVSVFVDNIYYPRPGIIRALSDIDYIDVYKGASGTSFGLNSTGGAIDIHTREPSATPEAEVSTSLGERGYSKTSAMLSGPVNDVISYRFNVIHAESQGNIKNLTTDDWINGYKRTGLRNQVLIKPSENFQLKLSVDYAEEHAKPANTIAYVSPSSTFPSVAKSIGAQYVTGGREVILDDVTRTHTEQGGGAAEALWSLDGGYKIRSITSYRFYRYSPEYADNLSVRIYSNSGTHVNDKDLSQDLRFESPKGKYFDYLFGLGYFHQNQDTVAHTRYADAAIVTTYAGSGYRNLDIIRYGKLDDEMTSAYTRGTFHITPRLDALFGLRETYEEKLGRFIRFNKANFDSGNIREYHVLPSADASLKYRLTDNWTPYVSYGYGQKSGGINVSAGAAKAAGYDTLLLRTETTHSIEAGVQGTLIPNKANLSAAVFRSRVSNFQTQGYDEETQQTYLMNAGTYVSQGIEAGLALRPLRGLSVNFGAVINDARYTDYKHATCPDEISATYCDLSGWRVFNTPKRVFTVDSRYTWNLENGYEPYVSGRYSYRSWTYGTVNDSANDRIPGYGLASFSVGVSGRVGASSRWDASVWVNNAFDKLYYTRLSGSSTVTGYVGDPRTLGLTLKYTY